jgi:hypothetical protein
VALCLLIAAVVTGGSVVHWRGRGLTAGEVPVAVAASSAALQAQGAALAAAASSASSAAMALDDAASAVAGMEQGSGEVEFALDGLAVCGVRRVPADELRRWKADPVRGLAQLQQLDEQTQRIGAEGLARISARLAAGNERQQVAARLLMRDLDGAALLAERSTDAQAYQMALSACAKSGGDVPSCARLNPGRWAELDPSDARPWLRMMQAAQARKDAAGVDAALAQAAARPRLSRGSYLLEAQAVAVADAVPDAAALGHALVIAIGIDAAAMPVEPIVLAKVCRGEALSDVTRLGHCRALARQVLANASDLFEAGMAQSLAERVGVPREQQAYDAATLKEAGRRFSERVRDEPGRDCAAMQRMKQFSAERAVAGELAMALAMSTPHQPVR